MFSHEETVTIFLQLCCLLAVGRGLGELARRYGQPSVIGELIAGILLGKAGLGMFGVFWFVNVDTGVRNGLGMMSLVGLVLLLLITGIETDFALIRRNAKSAFLVSLGGLLLPLASGYSLGLLLPDRYAGNPTAASLMPAFLAVCMGISALPVIGRVLIELKMMRRTVAQTLIASAMLEDATGWIILSVILAILETGSFSWWQIVHAIALVTLFVLVSLTAGQWVVRWILRSIRNFQEDSGVTLSAVLILTFFWSALAQYFGLESIFGAFVFGLVLGLLPVLSNDVVHTIHSITLNIFAPIFFTLAGLRVDVAAAVHGEAVYVTAAILIVAFACKTLGGYLGARYLAGMSSMSGIFLGVGLNARGSMGVIVATIGLSSGVFSPELFSSLVIMAIVTSLSTPPVLRWAGSRIPLTDEESERITREELQKGSLVANVSRILVPVRFRGDSVATPVNLVQAVLSERLATGREVSITVFTTVDRGQESLAAEYLESIATYFGKARVLPKVVINSRPGEAILEEAARGYDLLVMGTPQEGGTQTEVFSPLIDYIARLSPCPVIFVRGPKGDESWNGRFERILVPTNGSQASTRAADLAFALTDTSLGLEHIFLLKVVESMEVDYSSAIVERQLEYARAHVAELKEAGRMMGAVVEGVVDVGPSPEQVIVAFAKRQQIDLIILGISARAGAERLFLGPRVERILGAAPCPVLVLNG